ncbi:hypothetical protein HY636_05960 [Candidatus Woesearchaeota archaeon]|nr:hypothetical protein [Candidatus Woesearchaeota archaeon]
MSKANEDKGYQEILDIISEDESITILDDMLKNAAKITRKLEQIINNEFRADTIDEFKRVQSDVDKYYHHYSKLKNMIGVKDPLTFVNMQKYDEFVNSMLNKLTKGVGNQSNKTIDKFRKLITNFFNRDLKQDGQGILAEINLICSNYYLFNTSIISETLKNSLTSIPPIHQPNKFILSYGHAVHSVASFHDDKIIQKYLHSSSPIEVRAVKDDLERKLQGIIGVERPVVEDFLSDVPTGTADISRRQKKKFLDEGLTPRINALYSEMQMVCTSGMKYFDMRRELRADVMYLERSAALLQRVGNQINDNVKKESPTTEEIKELLDISTHPSYFSLHKELEGMVFVGREAKRYNELYSQVVDDAKELLVKLDDGARTYKNAVEKNVGETAGTNDNISHPQRAQEATPSTKEATISQTAAQGPKLEVVSGYAVIKTSPNSERAGTQTEVSIGASTGVSRREERHVRSVEYVESVEHVKPAQITQPPSSDYSANTTSTYDITAKLQDINEPEDSALKSFYNLLYRRDQIGRFIIASPTEIVQMFRLIKLQGNDKEEKGRDKKCCYSEADKTFLRGAIGYLNNPETLMYGAIKGSDVIQSAPRLMHDALMIIR